MEGTPRSGRRVLRLIGIGCLAVTGLILLSFMAVVYALVVVPSGGSTRPTATPEPDRHWRLVVESPDATFTVEWECERDLVERKERSEGTVVVGAEPTVATQIAPSWKVSCSVFKRQDGTLRVSLYQGEKLVDQVVTTRKIDRVHVFGQCRECRSYR